MASFAGNMTSRASCFTVLPLWFFWKKGSCKSFAYEDPGAHVERWTAGSHEECSHKHVQIAETVGKEGFPDLHLVETAGNF